MNREWLEWLVDPVEGKALQWSAEGKFLLSAAGDHRYPLLDGMVPDLLISEEVAPVDNVHRDYGSDFAYQEHYEKDAAFFDYFTPYESAVTRAEIRRLREAVIQRVPASARTILDVGCGSGWVARHFLPLGRRVISMDVSSTNPLRVQRELAHPDHLGLIADVYRLPIKKAGLDCIIAAEIMEHVPDPRRFVEILYDRLRPGGVLLITTPYNEKIVYHLCVHCNRPTPANAHLHSFHEHNIAPLLPAGAHWTWDRFGHNYLAKLRSHVLLNPFPFTVWKAVDRLFNRLWPQATRLLIEVRK